ncbi:MAG: GNAT family N-acetyltransferase [Chloroflexi bacterium]|nr:GNAT family N-acetyltransferase [Chloroflexota bacterium]
MSDDRYRFEPLGDHHDRAAFSCGVEPLDRYLREQASQDRRRDIAIPYVLLDTQEALVVGYYTLSTTSILSKALPADLARKLPRYGTLPAFLIGRLAVDRRYQGQGFGRRLLLDALFRCCDLSRWVGSMAVVVEAKDEAARAFYERYGFARFTDDEYRLFIAMRTLARMVHQTEQRRDEGATG